MANSATDIQDELWKLRLNVLQEKLRRRRDKYESYYTQFDDSKNYSNPNRQKSRDSRDNIDYEIEMARRRQQELKDLISEGRMLSLYQKPAWPDSPRRPEPKPEKKDRFEQFMEVMMFQNTQTQNMIMNNMLLENKTRSSPVVQQLPPPQPQPQPFPMPPPPPPMSLPPIYQPYSYYPYGPPQTFNMPNPVEPRRSASPSSPPQPPPQQSQRSERKPTKQRPSTAHYTFPGNESQRKIRQLGYAAIFCAYLDKQAKQTTFRPRIGFLFELKLKEIVSALHRIYLAPDGKILQILRTSVVDPTSPDYSILVDPKLKRATAEEQKTASRTLELAIENLVYNITEIMPSKGVLGTHRKSLLFELIRSDNKFPIDYFYDFEKNMLEVSPDNRTLNVTDEDAATLIIGSFLDRALIESVLAKPVSYRVVGNLDAKSESNLSILSSILFYIYRRTLADFNATKNGIKKGAKINIPPVPAALLRLLYTDEVILPLVKKMKKSIDYAEELIAQWAQEYVQRLKTAAF